MLFLTGCASVVKVDKQVVEVMPDSVARGIIEKKLGSTWANAPTVMKSGTCSIIPTEIPIIIRNINLIKYNPTVGRLFIHTNEMEARFLYTCKYGTSFPLNEVDAIEVTAALRALGACTSRYAKTTC
jgi:hypothetical protein